jgi:hypothetical protein
MMKNRYLLIVVHLLCCLAFLALPILFAPDTPIYWFQFNSYALHELTLYMLFIAFFYFNYFILIPKLYFSKRYVIYIATCVICFFVISYSPQVMWPSADEPQEKTMPPGAAPPPTFRADVEETNFQKHFFLPHINDDFFLYLIVLFVSMTLKINSQWRRTEKEKTEAQLSYLQSQINPHFLFNTLNGIYSLAIIEKSKDTATAIVKLSGLMRYVTTEAGSDLVDLEKEINYVSNYIELQKIRLGDTVRISYTIAGTFGGKRIVPLMLIPFIENAFKHGVNSEENSDINIAIGIKDYYFYLTVINNKVFRIPDEAKSGVGVQNTKRRLELLYPTRHLLTIEDTKETYKVNLHINLR